MSDSLLFGVWTSLVFAFGALGGSLPFVTFWPICKEHTLCRSKPNAGCAECRVLVPAMHRLASPVRRSECTYADFAAIPSPRSWRSCSGAPSYICANRGSAVSDTGRETPSQPSSMNARLGRLARQCFSDSRRLDGGLDSERCPSNQQSGPIA